MRLTLGVTNDSEWIVISPRLLKVMQLQAEIRLTGMASMGGGGALRALADHGGHAGFFDRSVVEGD